MDIGMGWGVSDLPDVDLTRRRAKLLVGILLFVFVVEGTPLVPSFLAHMWLFIADQAVVIQGRWDLVALNIAVFVAFAVPLAVGLRWRVDWQSASLGVYVAFVVSLFVEMYGVPLTIYLTSAALATSVGVAGTAVATPIITLDGFGFSLRVNDVIFAPGVADPMVVVRVLDQTLVLTFWNLVSLVIIAAGIVLIAVGWTTLYRTDEALVTTGLYASSRHPQYLGLILVVFGWFVHWPSLLTLAMFPVLSYFYYRLTIVEERELMESMEDRDAYEKYLQATPRFV